jgi:hypothetical protein
VWTRRLGYIATKFRTSSKRSLTSFDVKRTLWYIEGDDDEWEEEEEEEDPSGDA